MNPEIVLGPPGTGKTTTLIGYAEDELARGVPPDRIGFVSFTRRAAEEARDRAMKKFGLDKKDLPWFRTLHSLCFAALGLSSSDVFEGKRLAEFGDYVGVPISGKMNLEEGTTFGFEVGDRCLFMDNLARVRMIPLREQYEEENDELPWPLVNNVSHSLAAFKRANALLDFTDMLDMFAKSDWSVQLEVLIVDEAQDLSYLQWLVVQRLARGARRVVVAGDDDQAIYRWAGAAVEYFVGLPGAVRVLGQSWRVPRLVQDVASTALERIVRRRPKSWRPRMDEDGKFVDGSVGREMRIDDMDFVNESSTLILTRNTCFARDEVVPMLRHQAVMYSFRGSQPVRQSVISAVVSWEKLRRGETVSVAEAEKIYDFMLAREGYAHGHKKLPHWKDRETQVDMVALREYGGLKTSAMWREAFSRTRISDEESAYLVKILSRGESIKEHKPRIVVSTIHGSKGGEADHVILLSDMAWRTHRDAQRLPEDEARVWYVAATRARKRLTVVAARDRSRQYPI